MIALSGYPLGVEFIILDPSIDAGATGLGKHLHGQYDDQALLTELAEEADIVTYEFENVPAGSLRKLSETTFVAPSAEAVEIAQHRDREKSYARQAGLDTTAYGNILSVYFKCYLVIY